MKQAIRKYRLLFFAYLLICCFRSFQRPEGDIHIYLNAAKMFLNGENIYPYYLYPPPSILLFVPMTFAGDAMGRVVWAALNFSMFVRLLYLLYSFCESWLKEKGKEWHLFLIILISVMGMVDHNIQLGQMTIAMLWISLEFCYLLNKEKNYKAAFLLATGIILKIIPGIFMLWLLVKKKYKESMIVFACLISFALMPALFNGQFSNQSLWLDWITTVNPLGERFSMEESITVISLNGFIPAYFSSESEIESILNLAPQTVEILLNICRLLLFIFLWHLYRKAPAKLGLFEIAFTLLISVLVFPHQMKYSMLLFTPAMILILLNLYKSYHMKPKSLFKIGNVVLLMLFLVFSLYGRDTIGDTLVDKLDSSKFFTWLMLITFIKLIFDQVKDSKRKQRVFQVAEQ